MSYRYLENIATADAAFEVVASSLEELFQDAAIAIFEIMADTRTVRPAKTLRIELISDDIEGLFFDWLSELVYLKDTESILFCGFEVSILENESYELMATVSGDTIDQQKHILRSDIKAVTYHLFEFKKTGKNWTARVVLDI
jgi:SHS2 domain-containing protein